MKHACLACAFACLTFVSASATTVYSSNFQAETPGSSDPAFSGGVITQSPNGTNFLAGLGPGGSTTLTLSGLDPHTSVSLSFTLDAVGSLDGGPNPAAGGGAGDYFDVSYSSASSNANIFNYTFANYGGGETQTYGGAGSAPGTGAATINGLGYSGFPSDNTPNIQDAEYDIALSLTDSNGDISFTFTDNSNEGAGNEFYGIDNVVVTDNGSPSVPPVASTPEPASLALMSLGLCAGPFLRYRRRC